MDCSGVSPRTVRVSGAAHLFVPDNHLYLCDVDYLLSKLKMHNGAVMLSEAKHLCSLAVSRWRGNHQRLKAWPRGFCPLRCSFASLRMTFTLEENERANHVE